MDNAGDVADVMEAAKAHWCGHADGLPCAGDDTSSAMAREACGGDTKLRCHNPVARVRSPVRTGRSR